MKKIFVATALLVFGISNAQVSFKPGVKAGFSSSTITGYGADYRNSFYLGAYGNLALSKVYNMQFELMYLRQGADNVQTTSYSYDTGNYKLNKPVNVPLDYISLNLINKFNFDKFNLHIGPGLDVKVSEEKMPDYVIVDSYYDTKPYSINNDVDLTFNIGLGYNITDQFGIEVRMRQGIIEPIYANSNNFTSSSHLNRSFMVGATYTFK